MPGFGDLPSHSSTGGPSVHSLGLSDVNEVVEVAGGSRIEGSFFLFSGST